MSDPELKNIETVLDNAIKAVIEDDNNKTTFNITHKPIKKIENADIKQTVSAVNKIINNPTKELKEAYIALDFAKTKLETDTIFFISEVALKNTSGQDSSRLDILAKKLNLDIILELNKNFSKEIGTYLITKPSAGSSGGAFKKQKKVKGGFVDISYDTQKMYNAQGLVTELSKLNTADPNVNTNQPDPFSASGNSLSASFESLPKEMISGLTPSLSGGGKKKKTKK